MMSDKKKLYAEIMSKLDSFSKYPLKGINRADEKKCLTMQIIDSIRRVKYVSVIKDQPRTKVNTNSENFNPLFAAAWNKQNNHFDEACWLVFLITHFGRNNKTGWSLLNAIYGKLGDSEYWNWDNTSKNPQLFINWLEANYDKLKSCGGFGNHRKYESINPIKREWTGVVILSYIQWVGESKSHKILFDEAIGGSSKTPRQLFRHLYNLMNPICRFGRTGKFDYLTMLGKLELINVEPDSTYMEGSTGPLTGARLLFGETLGREELNKMLSELESHLGLYYGMQVLEDAICNWQKNPNKYIYFGG